MHQPSQPENISTPVPHQKGYAFNVNHVMQADWLQAWVGKHPLLDIGCGYGLNSQVARDQGISVVATEIDKETLKYLSARPENNHIDFQHPWIQVINA